MEHRDTGLRPSRRRARPPAASTGTGGSLHEIADTLTPAESRVLDQLLAGRTTTEIARALFVSEATVRTHLTHIYDKLGVRGRVDLLAGLVAHLGPDGPVSAFRLAQGPGPPSLRANSARGAPALSVRLSLISGAAFGGVGIRALGLLGVAFGLAHLSIAAWPLVGPVLLTGQALLTRHPKLSRIRLAMLVVGMLLSAEQLAVLVALHAA